MNKIISISIVLLALALIVNAQDSESNVDLLAIAEDSSGEKTVPLDAPIEVSPMISYQGRLLNSSGFPVNSDVEMTFRLYDAAVAGTLQWTETKNVPVSEGLFNTQLGDTTILPVSKFNQRLWLEIVAGGETLSPRQQLLGAPYAFSLIPGAIVEGSDSVPLLTVNNTANSLQSHGIVGLSYGMDGIRGISYGAGNADNGVYGETNSPVIGEAGVFGKSTDAATGGYFTSQNGSGVRAYSYGPFTSSYGVYSSSVNGTGLYGISSNSIGVYGKGGSGSGDYGGSFEGYRGVYGNGLNSYGGFFNGSGGIYVDGNNGVGGYFISNRDEGIQVSTTSPFTFDEAIEATSVNGSGIYAGSREGNGIYAISLNDTGVYGYSTNSNGVYGYSNYKSSDPEFPTGGIGVYGEVRGDTVDGVGVEGNGPFGVKGVGTVTGVTGSSGATGVYGYSSGNFANSYGVEGRSVNSYGVKGTGGNGYGDYGGHFTGYRGIYATNSSVAGSYWAAYLDGHVYVNGNIQKSGTVSFVQDHPTDPTKEIIYVSLEGGEAGTYTRGSGKLTNGIATINLPEDFGLVTVQNGLTVQVTATAECNGLYVASKSPTEIVVKELGGGTSDATFDFLVNGVRMGYENYQAIQDKNQESSSPASVQGSIETAMPEPVEPKKPMLPEGE